MLELDFKKDPSVLENIVDAMSVGVFTVDDQGRFVAWSEGAQRITGFQRDEVIGQPCHILEGPSCKGFTALRDLLDSSHGVTAEVCHQQCKVVARDGHEVHLQGSVRVLTDDHGKIAGAVGTFMDVTSLVQANEKIALLEEQTRSRDHFEQLIGKSAVTR